ncbi:GGDEF domain-containing protein [Saccharopolyspora spinosa]|uniref:Diguanylate cyclase (GGDEF)-like protein n=1 Tax=Saccharopolyspora spinosa TaxID=60894 RepID=A0A2N3Y5M8_SACSN|nr:GGDEF domain-containing protein [Saccharopolyspora spinosa]PKW18234.1 diguanylate cyclase (GGDEF)-like protein [Saccharopolyspora spinosa]
MGWLVVLTAAATVLVLTYADPVSRLADDLAALVNAIVAVVAYSWTGWSHTGPERRWRLFLAVGLGGWVAAQAVWTWHRAVHGAALAVPGIASALFLLFPAGVFAALLVIARADHARVRVYDTADPPRVLLLDGLIIVTALVALACEVLAVQAGSHDSPTMTLLTVSYTVGDLILIVVALLMAVALHSMWRPRLIWLVVGLCAMGASDIVYADSTIYGAAAPAAAELGYLIGTLLLIPAALAAPRPATARRRSVSLALLAVPYVPLTAVLGMVVINMAGGSPYPDVVYVLSVIIALVILRHFTTLLQLYRAHRLLAQAVLQDPLTGVANRVLLADLLDEAVSSPQFEERGLIYVDLDDFKTVNDRLGHQAGDELLRITAHRLRGCVRDGDTVARIGGDEFVILLIPPPHDPEELVQHLADEVAQPVALETEDNSVRITASIGYHRIAPGQHPSDALAHADQAMYQDKRSRAD